MSASSERVLSMRKGRLMKLRFPYKSAEKGQGVSCRSPALALIVSLALPPAAHAADLKPRIIVLTDIAPITIEPDDMESSIRLMAHADLFEIEALVATTGWSNGGGQEHPELMRNVIDAYEKDLPNLKKRSNQGGFLADELKQTI